MNWYWIQLGLNVLWPYAFFGLQQVYPLSSLHPFHDHLYGAAGGRDGRDAGIDRCGRDVYEVLGGRAPCPTCSHGPLRRLALLCCVRSLSFAFVFCVFWRGAGG